MNTKKLAQLKADVQRMQNLCDRRRGEWLNSSFQMGPAYRRRLDDALLVLAEARASYNAQLEKETA